MELTHPNIPFYKRDFFLTLSFYLLLAILLANRVLLFLNLNLDYIDSDMPYMWAGVRDYSKGLFYEPRFYGQDYNTFVESLLAVPLYWSGIPVYYALPIVAHCVSVFPFLFAAFYLFYKGRKENGILVLVILLCLTPGYYVMTSQPRGISGVFLTGFFILNIFYPTRLRLIILNTILAVLAYFLTPNSVVVSVPFLAFLFFNNYKSKRYYFATVASLLSCVPFYFIFDKFYKDHPDYVIYGLQNLWSPKYFVETLGNLDKSFAHVNFFVEESCAILLLVFLVMGVALYRINKIAFLSFLAFPGILLFSFFSSKVTEGVVWPFYSFSRMYIGIPMVLVLFTVFFQIRSRTFTAILVVITLLYSTFKFSTFKTTLAYHVDEKRWNGIHLVPLSAVLESSEFFMNTCKKNTTNFLLISNTHWLSTYLAYGGQVIFKDFPQTQETESERRYWVRNENKKKVFEKFIFLGVDYDFDKRCAANPAFKIRRLDDYGLFVVEENKLRNEEFIALVVKLKNQ